MRIKNEIVIGMLALLCMLQVNTAMGASPKEKRMKSRLLELVKAQRQPLADNATAIWGLAELGFLEHKSATILQKRLSDAGFTVQTGVAGMPTAFVASYRNGEGPVIGLLAEYDALGGLSQDSTCIRHFRADNTNGHGCGHNLIGSGAVAAAVALRQWMEENGVHGEIRLYGCPAEEGGFGKVYMVRDGLFNGVDAVMHWHPTDYNGYYSSPHMASVSTKFRFRGVSAHAAAAPDRGRSALDGAMVRATAVEYLREHVPDKTRIHYIISNGGRASNVVPDFAEIDLTVRHANSQVAREVWRRIVEISRGAATATETTAEYELTSGCYPLLVNHTLIDVAATNFNSLSLPLWNKSQMEFAEGIASTLEHPGPLDPTIVFPPYPAKEVNASTDVGDISWVVPTVGVFTMGWIPGTAAHSWQAVAASGSSLGVQSALVASEIIATTVCDLFLNPELIAAAKQEMQQDRGTDFKYEPLLGDRKPALDYQQKNYSSQK